MFESIKKWVLEVLYRTIGVINLEFVIVKNLYSEELEVPIGIILGALFVSKDGTFLGST